MRRKAFEGRKRRLDRRSDARFSKAGHRRVGCLYLPRGEFNKLQQNNRTRTLRFNKYLALRVGSAGRLSGFAPGEWVTVEDYYPGGFEKLRGQLVVWSPMRTIGVLSLHLVIGRIIGRKASSWSRIFRVSDQNWRKSIYSRTRRSIRSMREVGAWTTAKSGILNFFATHECTSRCKDLLRPRVSEEELRKRRDRVAKRPGGWRMAKGDSDEEEKDPASKPPSFAHAQRETRLIFRRLVQDQVGGVVASVVRG